MAIRFMDSFSHYGSANLLQKWTTLGELGLGERLIVAGAGRCKQNAFRLRQVNIGSGEGPVWHPPYSGLTEGVMGAGFAFNNADGDWSIIYSLMLNGARDNSRVLSLAIASNGTLVLYKGGNGIGGGFTEIARSLKAIQDSSWHSIAWTFKTNTSTGASAVYVDGDNANPWFTFSGNTGANSYTDIQLGQSNGGTGGPMFYSDFYYGDAQADLKGDSRVYARLPNADGATLQWTPKSGTAHYLMVDENPPDNGVTYNSNAPGGTGNIDTYKFPPIGIPSGTVYAVQVLPMLAKSDVGFRSGASVIRQDGINYTGSAQAVADGEYLYYFQVYEQDPTGAAWTVDHASNDEFGVAQTG